MDRLSKRIEVPANVAIIAVALLLGLVLINNYLIVKQPENPAVLATKNAEISLPGVNWSKNRHLVGAP